MRNNKGFSLVELIVVIAIMAVLAAVAIPTFATFIGKAQSASDVDFMNQVESAIELAYAQTTVEIESIKVECNGEKKPIAITVKFEEKINDTTDTVTITADDKDDNNEKADAALVIDWNYEFKSIKGAGIYTLKADGKELDTAQ